MKQIVLPDISQEKLALEISRVSSARGQLLELETDILIGFLDTFGKNLATPECAGIEGLAFLSSWLRRSNLEKLLRVNFGEFSSGLDRFIAGPDTKIRASARGLGVQWVAGNIPTLAIFSFVLSLLCKNGNVIRVPRESIGALEIMLRIFADTSYVHQSMQIAGETVLKAACFVHFPSADTELNATLSRAADFRVIWGGIDAVSAITQLPRKEYCEDIVFGPKFSLAMLSATALRDKAGLARDIRILVKDVVIFDQAACSSPQIIFVEGSLKDGKEVVELFDKELAKVRDTNPKRRIDSSVAAAIINYRAEYALDPERDLLASSDLDYSVFLDSGAVLSDGLQSRCVFVRVVSSLDDVVPLLSPKIQTVALVMPESERRSKFAEALARVGVSRIVRPGTMNIYEMPWDGMRAMDRMVRWVSCN